MDIIPNTLIDDFIDDVENLKSKPIVQQIRVKPLTVQTSLTVLISASLSTDAHVDEFVQNTVRYLESQLRIDVTRSEYFLTHNGAGVLIDLYHEL